LNGARGVKVDPELERVVRPVFEKLKEKVEKAKGGKDMSDELKKYQEELKTKGGVKEERAGRA